MTDDTAIVVKKRCRICEELKPLDAFGSHKTHVDGKQNYCKSCRNAQARNALTDEQKARKAANARKFPFVERRKIRRRFEFHRITQVEFELLLEAQDSKCAICHGTETQEHRALVIDHHHESGRVRGLICSRCNKALGGFKEDPKILQAAIDYLAIEDDVLDFLDQVS